MNPNLAKQGVVAFNEIFEQLEKEEGADFILIAGHLEQIELITRIMKEKLKGEGALLE